jgi:triosephosphate isomerase
MRKTIVAGNWKMNGTSESIRALLDGITAGVPVVDGLVTLVCPPAVYLSQVKELLGNAPVVVGAQNVSAQPKGAFTGEWSLEMLQDLGCEYVILGHSERRSLFKETDADVADKVDATLTAGLTPILCVGETLAQREAGETLAVVATQVDAVVQRVGIERFASVVIAYEPVWAIGTGRTASVEEVAEVHAAIRAGLVARFEDGDQFRILYGGSVKPSNAKELMAVEDVDGALVGGASLKVEDFWQIIESCA